MDEEGFQAAMKEQKEKPARPERLPTIWARTLRFMNPSIPAISSEFVGYDKLVMGIGGHSHDNRGSRG